MFAPLSPENEAFIQQAIARGDFTTREEALETGVSLLRERKELLDRLAESRRQLDEGDFTEYDDQSLREFFQELKGRVRGSSTWSAGLAGHVCPRRTVTPASTIG